MSENVLDRVRRLVALASSSVEEEARTAAVTACRLIREHGLEISEVIAKAAEETREERRQADTTSPPNGPERWSSRRAERERRAKEASAPIDVPHMVGRAVGSFFEKQIRKRL